MEANNRISIDTKAQILAQRLRQIVSAHQFQSTRQLTCSFGVGAFKAGDSLDRLLHRADQGLYRPKKAGKNRVE